MDQIISVISDAGDKVAGAANDASKTFSNVVGDNKTTTKSGASSSSESDTLTSTCPSLSKKQRMIGFVSCFVLGFLVTFGSTFALIVGADNGTKFGITYSFGNIISLCGLHYLTMIVVVLTLSIATPQLGLVVLLFVFIQCGAAIWYSASYIPYGRKSITTIAQKICGK